MSNFPQRTKASISGLIKMIEHINRISPTKDMTIIEIGSYIGLSTAIFAEHFKSVIAIDPWVSGIGDISDSYDMNEVYKEYLQRTAAYKNITTIRDYSYNVAATIPDNSIDALYVDGLHTYAAVKKDIQLFMGKVKQGGFICGHDYCRKFPGVVKAVDEMVKGIRFFFPDTSWMHKKIS